MVLYCDEFTYNGKSSADFELVPCTFNASDSENTYLTKELYATSMTYNRPKRNISGAVYSEPLQFTISVMHNDSKRFTPIEIREIQSWLTSNNQPAEFTAFHREYTNHHFYGVVTSLSQIVAGGYVCGFTFTLTTNSPYAWSDEYKQTEHILPMSQATSKDPSTGIGWNVFNIELHSDEPEMYVYPIVELTNPDNLYNNNIFMIYNLSDNNQGMGSMSTDSLILHNHYNYIFNMEYKIIIKIDEDGNSTPVSLSEIGLDTNYVISANGVETNEMSLYWLRLLDGKNTIAVCSNEECDLTFKYRLPVKAGVQ